MEEECSQHQQSVDTSLILTIDPHQLEPSESSDIVTVYYQPVQQYFLEEDIPTGETITIQIEPSSSSQYENEVPAVDAKEGEEPSGAVVANISKKKRKSKQTRLEAGETPGYLCNECDQKFFHSNGLYRHRSALHPDAIKTRKRKVKHGDDNVDVDAAVKVSRNMCQVCSQEFSGTFQLYMHKIANHPDVMEKRKRKVKKGDDNVDSAVKVSQIMCGVCNESFRHPSQLYIHKIAKHPDAIKTRKPYLKKDDDDDEEKVSKVLCQVCKQEFPNRFQLYNHKRAKHPDAIKTRDNSRPKQDEINKVYQCPICFQQFKYEESLLKHDRHHIDSFRLTCGKDGCNYGATNKRLLKRHQAMHGAKPRKRIHDEKCTLVHSDDCQANCTCKLPLLKFELVRQNPPKNPKSKKKTKPRYKRVPILIENPTPSQATNHTLTLMRGALKGHPLTLPLHRNTRKSKYMASKNSWFICQSNNQADLKGGIMFLRKSVDGFQLQPNDANELTKGVRQVINNKKQEWSAAHNVAAGDSTWDQKLQDKIWNIVHPLIEDIRNDPEFVKAAVVQKELTTTSANFKIGKPYDTSICNLCDDNLKFPGALKEHLCTHKRLVVNKLEGLCMEKELDDPQFVTGKVCEGICQVTLKIGEIVFTETSASEDRAIIKVACDAFLHFAGSPLKLKAKSSATATE